MKHKTKLWSLIFGSSLIVTTIPVTIVLTLSHAAPQQNFHVSQEKATDMQLQMLLGINQKKIQEIENLELTMDNLNQTIVKITTQQKSFVSLVKEYKKSLEKKAKLQKETKEFKAEIKQIQLNKEELLQQITLNRTKLEKLSNKYMAKSQKYLNNTQQKSSEIKKLKSENEHFKTNIQQILQQIANQINNEIDFKQTDIIDTKTWEKIVSDFTEILSQLKTQLETEKDKYQNLEKQIQQLIDGKLTKLNDDLQSEINKINKLITNITNP